MVDGARLPASSRLGWLLRRPLALIPLGTVVPVLSGRLKGAKWVVGSSPHGCWLGTYEREGQLLAWRLAQGSRVIYDVGANVGFYSLLFSRAAPPGAEVIAYEPVPENVQCLSRHLMLNRNVHIRIREVALGEEPGDLDLRLGQIGPKGA